MIKSWWMSVLLLRVIKLTFIQPGPSVLMNLTLEMPWDFVRSRRPMMMTWQWNTSCITCPLYGESTSPDQYLKRSLDIFFVVGNYNLLNKQSRCRVLWRSCNVTLWMTSSVQSSWWWWEFGNDRQIWRYRMSRSDVYKTCIWTRMWRLSHVSSNHMVAGGKPHKIIWGFAFEYSFLADQTGIVWWLNTLCGAD